MLAGVAVKKSHVKVQGLVQGRSPGRHNCSRIISCQIRNITLHVSLGNHCKQHRKRWYFTLACIRAGVVHLARL